MSDNGYHSTSEIERDVERSRARVSDTLRELRERMSPGQVVDEVLDYARASGGVDFARNLGRSVTDNPLPLLLIGTGIAWLMTSSNGRPQAGPSVDQLASTGRDAAQRAGEWMQDSSDGSSGRMDDMADRMGDMAEGARDTTNAAVDRMRGAAQGVGSKMSEYADSAKGLAGSAKNLASSARSNAQNLGDQMQRTWNSLADDQPLVLGAMGLALGALLGAGLPSTRTENRLMGDASDALKGEVKKEAAHQYEKAKDVAAEASKTVQDEMERKGFGTDTAGETGSRDETSTSSTAKSQSGGSGPERMGFEREPGARGEGQT